MDNCRLVIGDSCFLNRIVSPQLFARQLCNPSLSLFAQRDSLVLVYSRATVAQVLRVVALPQILNPIVIPDPVDVVKLNSKLSVEIHPDQMMYSEHLTIDHRYNITLRLPLVLV